MTWLPHAVPARSAHARGRAAAPLLAAGAGLAVLVSLLFAGGSSYAVVLLGALLLALCVAVVPVEWAPSLALAGTVLIPVEYAPVPQEVASLTPFVLLFAKPVFVTFWQRRWQPGLTPAVVASVLLAGVLAAMVPFSPDPDYGRRWVVAFVLGVTVPVLWACRGGRTRRLRATFEVLAGVLGGYAVVETTVGSNFLLGSFFAGSPLALGDAWSTYRATTTLGHPLVNAAFLACGAALSLGSYLDRGDRARLGLAVAAAVGVAATASRSGIAAMACALLVTLLLSALDRAARVRAFMVTAVGTLTVLFLGATLLGAVISRSASTEGAESSAWREQLWRGGRLLAETRPWFGHGPGSLSSLSQQMGLGPTGNFENSWLDVLLMSGLVGVVLMACLFAAAGARALRHRDPGGVGAVLALAITAGAFNLWAGHPTLLLLTGTVLAIALSPAREDRSPDRPVRSATRASVADG
ncbi:O-antigen ligase family protein [Geodermatophilus sp. URMC 63]